MDTDPDDIIDTVAAAIADTVDTVMDHPWHINNGECRLFATALRSTLIHGGMPAESIQLKQSPTGYPNHYWLEIGGRCYDAEVPRGVSHWWKLPIFLTDALHPTSESKPPACPKCGTATRPVTGFREEGRRLYRVTACRTCRHSVLETWALVVSETPAPDRAPSGADT